MSLTPRKHNPFAPTRPDVLYMLIDTTTLETTKVLKVGNMRQVQLLGQVYAAEGKTCIAPIFEGRGFTKLSQIQLQYLLWNTFGQRPPEDYAELVRICKEMIATIEPCDDIVSNLEFLVEQLTPYVPGQPVLAPGEAKPAARPKGTSVTGVIWTICDEVLQEMYNGVIPADWKELRTKAAGRCEAEGFHSGTFGVQYSKWKGSKMSGQAGAKEVSPA